MQNSQTHARRWILIWNKIPTAPLQLIWTFWFIILFNILPSYEAGSQMYRILVLEHSLQTSTCYVKKIVFFFSFCHWWLGKGMYSHSQACTHNSWLIVNAVFSTAKFVKISFKFLNSYIILRLVSISGYKLQI